MVTLRQAAISAKGELWQLEYVDLDNAEIKDEIFNKTEKDETGKDIIKSIAYKVLIVDGKKFNIREKQINKLKELMERKPTVKKVKLMKLSDGQLEWIAIE